MIHVENLTRRYGDFLAVDKVSFDISHGEIVGLLGHNGAGKTTIMKMLTGFLEPSDGLIEVDGIDVCQDAESVQSLLGYLPENLPVYPEMAVADYLEYVAGIRGIEESQRLEAVRQVIIETELMEKALDPISTLSRGYKQRVGVAQAILHRPKLLILDEPTNGLDPSQTLQMRSLIQRLAKNATVILSTHIMQEVDAICDRALILRNGELALDERMESLHQSNNLQLLSNATEEQVKAAISGIETIESISNAAQQQANYQYSLKIKENADIDAVTNRVAQALVSADIAIYALGAKRNDLESVFREINESQQGIEEGVANAA